MKLKQINHHAVVEAPEVGGAVIVRNPTATAMFPGSIIDVPAGVNVDARDGEVVLVELAAAICRAGVILQYPTHVVQGSPEGLVLTLFNRSSFVVEIKQNDPLCRLVSVATSSKPDDLELIKPRERPPEVTPPVEEQALAPANSAPSTPIAERVPGSGAKSAAKAAAKGTAKP